MQGDKFRTLSDFYEEDGMARRIIDVVPEEMISRGLKLTAKTKKSLNQNGTHALTVNLLMRLHGRVCLAVQAFWLCLMTTGNLHQSRKVQSLKALLFTIAIRFQLKRKLIRAVFATVSLKFTRSLRRYQIFVHYTRIYIDGERVTNRTRQQNDGWGASVLNARLIEAIVDYNYCHELATQLRRKQQAVWKARDLAACDDDDGRYAARRLAQVDDESGVGKAIGIDANDEEYQILNSDVTGVPEFYRRRLIAFRLAFMKSSSKIRTLAAYQQVRIQRAPSIKLIASVRINTGRYLSSFRSFSTRKNGALSLNRPFRATKKNLRSAKTLNRSLRLNLNRLLISKRLASRCVPLRRKLKSATATRSRFRSRKILNRNRVKKGIKQCFLIQKETQTLLMNQLTSPKTAKMRRQLPPLLLFWFCR
ncbi:terminase large subunit [Salmonella virus STSR3]|nr:terminase large subunit [Salmonella virus STSR3]